MRVMHSVLSSSLLGNRRIIMDKTFGNILLYVNQIIDGNTLSYGYSNRNIPDKIKLCTASVLKVR